MCSPTLTSGSPLKILALYPVLEHRHIQRPVAIWGPHRRSHDCTCVLRHSDMGTHACVCVTCWLHWLHTHIYIHVSSHRLICVRKGTHVHVGMCLHSPHTSGTHSSIQVVTCSFKFREPLVPWPKAEQHSDDTQWSRSHTQKIRSWGKAFLGWYCLGKDALGQLCRDTGY